MNIELGDNMVLILSLFINAILVPFITKYHYSCKNLKAQLDATKNS